MFSNRSNQSSEFPTHGRNIYILLSWLRSSLFCADEAPASSERRLFFFLFLIQVCIFIGETLLFLNWAITADILMVSAQDLFLRGAALETPPVCQSAGKSQRYNVAVKHPSKV